MSTERQQKIYAAYEAIETSEPDISTERLLSMTAERSRCDVGDVFCKLLRAGVAQQLN
jgi:hypothetical protein